MATNQVIGGQGLTANPGMVERQYQRNVQQQDLAQALKEADFRERYALEKQKLAQTGAQRDIDNQYREKVFAASQAQPKAFSLSEALYKDYKSGDESPETLKGLGMYVAPPKEESSATAGLTPYQAATLGISAEKLAMEKQAKETKMADNEEIKLRATDNVMNSAQTGLDIISQIEKEGGINKFGFTGGLPSVPGTSRVNWEANVDRLLTKQVLDVMNSLKNASRTGATGFGALSEKELRLIQNASTSLRRTSSPEDAQMYLDQMKEAFSKVLNPEQGQGMDQRARYNQLRSQGVSPAEARQQVGL